MRAISLLILLSVPLTAQNSQIEYERLKPAVIQERLEAVKPKLHDRRTTLEALFREAGCEGENLTTEKVPRSPEPNILCALPGSEPEAGTIVVGGHYDRVSFGIGAVDDWSGAVLLPSLYQSLKKVPRRRRYLFIAFAGEEEGLLGSKEYVRKLSPSEKEHLQAMINLECLGMSSAKVWASRADKNLLEAYANVARSLNLPLEASNVDNVGDDDSHPFLNARIPVLTIHSITADNIRVLHSGRDQVKAIQPDPYYDAYRLAATLLAFLDSLGTRPTN